MTGIYELTLRASDGRERRTLAWLPTEAIRQDFYEKARRNGISIVKIEKLEIKGDNIEIGPKYEKDEYTCHSDRN